ARLEAAQSRRTPARPAPQFAGERGCSDADQRSPARRHRAEEEQRKQCRLTAHDDRATLRSRSTFRFSAITSPSTPSRCRIEWNSERWTASWLIVPSRYTSEIRHEP